MRPQMTSPAGVSDGIACPHPNNDAVGEQAATTAETTAGTTALGAATANPPAAPVAERAAAAAAPPAPYLRCAFCGAEKGGTTGRKNLCHKKECGDPAVVKWRQKAAEKKRNAANPAAAAPPAAAAAALTPTAAAAAAATVAEKLRKCSRGCGCFSEHGRGSKMNSSNCLLNHGDNNAWAREAAKGLDEEGSDVCVQCQVHEVCPIDGCLCSSWTGCEVDTSKCPRHSGTEGVELRLLDKLGCGSCSRVCYSCGCRETSNSRCRAMEHGHGKVAEHAIGGDAMTVRKDGKAVCAGCVAEHMCRRCFATRTHVRFVKPRATVAAGGAGGGDAADGGCLWH